MSVVKLVKGQRLKVIRDHSWFRQGETVEVVADQGKRILVKGPYGSSDIYRWGIKNGDIEVIAS